MSPEGLPDFGRIVRSQIAKTFRAQGVASSHSAGEGLEPLEVLACADCPAPGVVSYATVGLAKDPVHHEGKATEIRLELLTAAYARYPNVAAALASAAFRISQDRWFCAAGIVFPDVMELYEISSTLTDFYFSPPFLWTERPTTVETSGLSLGWLLAVPIARSESVYAVAHGPLELERRLEDSGVDVFDWSRPAVI
jgi:hypothetical protein